MGIRTTNLMMQRTALADINRAQRALAQTQQQAATGLRINRPGDDPRGAALATTLRQEIGKTDQLDSNASAAISRLSVTESALARVNDVLVRAKELALQGANAEVVGQEGRDILAIEIASLHSELLDVANSKVGGDSLFAGYETDTPAFSRSGAFVSGSPPPTVGFNGDGNEIQLEVEDGVRVSSSLDGRRVFQGDRDGVGGIDPGATDVFSVLENLWQGLTQGDDTAIRAATDDLDAAQSQTSLERARVGTRIARIERSRTRLAEQTVDLERTLSDVQDADTVRVFSNLTLQQTSLTAALQVSAQALQLDLLDFLQ